MMPSPVMVESNKRINMISIHNNHLDHMWHDMNHMICNVSYKDKMSNPQS